MGLITDMFFGLANIFKWSFENILYPISLYMDWLLFAIGAGMLIWLLFKLREFGDENEKDYKGW